MKWRQHCFQTNTKPVQLSSGSSTFLYTVTFIDGYVFIIRCNLTFTVFNFRNKQTIISPKIITSHSIPFGRTTQLAGEFMITFPRGYHSGFNYGFNCAELTNFASPRWIKHKKRAELCVCKVDTACFSMDKFVKRHQPDEYDLWVQGKEKNFCCMFGFFVPLKKCSMYRSNAIANLNFHGFCIGLDIGARAYRPDIEFPATRPVSQR